MTPVLILILFLLSDGKIIAELKTDQIQFRTMESCEREAQKINHELKELKELKVKAICIDRSIEDE